MIRPIETNMSLFAVDHKAHQPQNNPGAPAALAAQQAEALKKAHDQMNTVQKSPATEGDVKIRDRDSEKNKGEQRKRRRGHDTEEEAETDTQAKDGGGGRLDFLA